MKPASFLLIKVNCNVQNAMCDLTQKKNDGIMWVIPVYGPCQIICYLEKSTYPKLEQYVETLREESNFLEIDARRVKPIPEDASLKTFSTPSPDVAVLLINVNYKVQREREVTCRLREIDGVTFARAMWGPNDIIVVVEAKNPEEMRNLICDKIKTIPAVAGNSTLYGYSK